MREQKNRYVTTERNETAVSETGERVFNENSPGYCVKYAGLDEPLANVWEGIALVEEDSARIVDTVEVERSGSQIEHLLAVPTFRAHNLLGETSKLELGSDVRVDTSRESLRRSRGGPRVHP